MNQRTYWHLESAKRLPSEYEIATSALLYYRTLGGFEVTTPISDWYQKYQAESPLTFSDWDAFRDPSETTYTGYVTRARDRETFVDGLLAGMEADAYGARLSESWRGVLGREIPVLLYPCHALQMAAAYIGQLAPSSRLVVACAFQTGNEIRRIQRLAYRVAALQQARPDELQRSQARARWEQHPAWQPLRKVMESMLVTYDLGEALVALNLVVKPMFDCFFGRELAAVAERNHDPLFSQMLDSFEQDNAWQRDWTGALFESLIGESTQNESLVRGQIARWRVSTCEALTAVESVFDVPAASSAGAAERARAAAEDYWLSFGLSPASLGAVSS
jgi:toluene monooxygenase system protein E